MRLLLDTHIFLWCVNNDRNLSKSSRTKITNATEVYISSATIWEAAIKIKLGKLHANIDNLVQAVEDSGFLTLPISTKHAAYVYQLPYLHSDPFDRMLISQALCEPLRFLTADKALKKYSDLIEIV
ncbi:MAG: PilT protein [uncultured bacterium]|nr:MAG: PilT protein [uncultured bacterium]OGT15876.1 MAG: twitching motility protein PilT [Gammaproteobacteria bacterium RIFCSPHIGHO2_02_FULL_38_33]OGT23336.1 MAG: twitching motility protein PilT [Gammaproteobacteria bacterium RIFCSPHIGHO2_12_38_15]OGT68805.1 MAG: twitching motility protein PilT [Gammaproteobacteria bacterium RIFCSPLOWO2_02_FULL_38_11]OGT75906.1 MAG: twitching motility protein PilT [Gammaproteobacteria bacterium RIFCSPLOWO2_12_FULL_38_14]